MRNYDGIWQFFCLVAGNEHFGKIPYKTLTREEKDDFLIRGKEIIMFGLS
jgi:hypothetical protein